MARMAMTRLPSPVGVFVILSILSVICPGAEGARCVIVAPSVVTVGVPFTSHAIVYDVDDVIVTLQVNDGQTGVLMTDKSVTTTNGEGTEIKMVLTAPPQPYDVGQYYVTLRANTSSPDVQLPTESRVLVTLRQGHVFIQMTEVKVFAGDLISGRLFSVDANLRSLSRDIRVELLDPSGRAVERTEAISLEKEGGHGTYRFQLQAPHDASPGTWRVQARHGYKFLSSDATYIEVSDSSLPPMFIAASTDKTILPTMKNVQVTLSVRYPSGNAVIGKASVELLSMTKEGKTHSLGTPSPPVPIGGMGEASFSVKLTDHNLMFDDLVGSHLVVRSRIMDHDSGMMQTKDDVTGVFVTSPYVIDLSRSATTYKPSLSYYLRATVLDVSGNPVHGLEVTVVTGGGNTTTMRTNQDGEISQIEDVGARLSAIKYKLEAGPEQLRATAELVVRREVSQSGAYIRLSPPNQALPVVGNAYPARVHFYPADRVAKNDYGVLHYIVTSKNNVQQFHSKTLLENKEQIVTVTIDYTMTPAFHLTVFYVRRDGHVISDGIWVNTTSGPCQNDIKLSGPTSGELNPNEKLSLKVEGEPKSFVSTQIIEDRQLAGPHIEQLTKRSLADLMMTGQCKQDGGRSTEDVFYHAGLTVLSDMDIEVPSRDSPQCVLNTLSARGRHHRHRRQAENNAKEFQKDFASYREVKSIVLGHGEETVEKAMNSLAGLWHLQAMGVSATSGFCVSDVLQVRTRKEERHLQVLVPHQGRVNEVLQVTGLFYWKYNVTQVTAEVQVEAGVCSLTRYGEWSTPTPLNVTAGRQVAISWPIVPLTAREHVVRVRVKATPNQLIPVETWIEKTFVALPAGAQRKVEQTFLLGVPKPTSHPPDRSTSQPGGVLRVVSAPRYDTRTKNHSLTVSARLPAGALYGSGKVEVSITGEPLGHVVLDLPAKGLASLVDEEPIGCGEQSMMRIGPLVYATQYLKLTDQLTEQLRGLGEAHITDSIDKGIYYMNKFRNESGAFSAWPGKDPSTWLTAYVIKVYAQASVLTTANDTLSTLVCEGARYVAGRQGQQGQFDDPLGILLMESIAGGLEGTVAMSAYVTVALLEVQKHLGRDCQQMFNLNGTVTNAVAYIAEQSAQTSDPYTLSMMANGLLMARHPMGQRVLETLLAESVDDEGRHWKHWQIPLQNISRSQRVNLYDHPVLTLEIETAAYTLLALMEADKKTEASGVAMWLTSQHRSNGRFISTQDTVVALQALTSYRSQVTRPDLHQKVAVKEVGTDLTRSAKELTLTNDARNLRHVVSFDLPAGRDQHVSIRLQGEGEVRVEVVCSYNTMEDAGTCPFSLETQVTRKTEVPEGSTCYDNMTDTSACVETCYSYPSGNRTNMAILHVGLHHLHRPHTENLNNIVSTDQHVDHYETNAQAVVFYLNQIPSEEHCISFVVNPSSPIPVNSMPVGVHLYDYHDPGRLRCEKLYQPNSRRKQNKAPVDTYLSDDNEFHCAEVPQPEVHDYLEKHHKSPKSNENLEELFCNHDNPADVYALVVKFTSGEFLPVLGNSGDQNMYFLEAQVEKVIKEGNTASVLGASDPVHFKVKGEWMELKQWVKDTLDEPHLVVGTSSAQLTLPPGQDVARLHMDSGNLYLGSGHVYLQRIVPNDQVRKKTSTRIATKQAWKELTKDDRETAIKNKKFIKRFKTCSV